MVNRDDGGFAEDVLKANQPIQCHLSPPQMQKKKKKVSMSSMFKCSILWYEHAVIHPSCKEERRSQMRTITASSFYCRCNLREKSPFSKLQSFLLTLLFFISYAKRKNLKLTVTPLAVFFILSIVSASALSQLHLRTRLFFSLRFLAFCPD